MSYRKTLFFSIPDKDKLSTYYIENLSIYHIYKKVLSIQHIEKLPRCGIEKLSLSGID